MKNVYNLREWFTIVCILKFLNFSKIILQNPDGGGTNNQTKYFEFDDIN